MGGSAGWVTVREQTLEPGDAASTSTVLRGVDQAVDPILEQVMHERGSQSESGDGQGCAEGHVFAKGFVEHAMCAVATAPAATGHTQFRTQLLKGRDAAIGGVADLVVGHPVADTYVHGTVLIASSLQIIVEMRMISNMIVKNIVVHVPMC